MRQIAITIETTGPEVSEGNRVVEIGCVELIDGKRTGRTYHQYINPMRRVEEPSIDQHGLTNEFLADKPCFEDILKNLSEFLSSSNLITYNADFIFSFIRHEFELSKHKFNPNSVNTIIDVLEIANERHPNQNNSLFNLCDRYYVSTSQSGFSGALFRAELIAELFLALRNVDARKLTSDLSRYRAGENLVVIKSFSELDEAMDGISKSALCRGVSNHEYALLPSLFRHTDVESADTRENNLMWVFKTHAKAHLNRIPDHEIEWLAIAQHHGLPTRLLDWSLSPLVACFFAVQSLSSSDAAVYIYDVGKFKKEEEIKLEKLKDIVAFFPSHATKRVTAQSGMFTIHPTNQMKLEAESVKKFVIPSERKKYFLEKLTKYGVHQATMFPDLDGLSNYIRYLNKYT